MNLDIYSRCYGCGRLCRAELMVTADVVLTSRRGLKRTIQRLFCCRACAHRVKATPTRASER